MGRVLELCESAAGALPSFFGVALLGPLLLPSLPLLVGFPPEPPVDFLEMSLRHTFLWLCRAEEDLKDLLQALAAPIAGVVMRYYDVVMV